MIYSFKYSRKEFFVIFLKDIHAIFPYFRNIQLYNRRYRKYKMKNYETFLLIDKIKEAFIWDETIEGKLYWRIIDDIGNMLFTILNDNTETDIDLIIEKVNEKIEEMQEKLKKDKGIFIDSLVKRINHFIQTQYASFIRKKIITQFF